MISTDAELQKAFQKGQSDCVAFSMLLRNVENPYPEFTDLNIAYKMGWVNQLKSIRLEYQLSLSEEN